MQQHIKQGQRSGLAAVFKVAGETSIHPVICRRLKNDERDFSCQQDDSRLASPKGPLRNLLASPSKSGTWKISRKQERDEKTMSEENRDPNGEQKKTETEDDLEDFTVDSIRGAKQTKLELLIWSKMWRANRQNKLERCIEMCELATFAKALKPELEVDLNLVDVLLQVAQSLITAQTKTLQVDYYHKYIICTVSWSFKSTKENYLKYISPWLKNFAYWKKLVGAVPDITEPMKVLRCIKCGFPFVDYRPEQEPQVRDWLIKEYKDYLKTDYKFREPQKTLIARRIRVHKAIKEDPSLAKITWRPPMKISTILVCPRCKNEVTLGTEYTLDNMAVNAFYDRMSSLDYRLEERIEGAKEESYRKVVESQKWKEFFVATEFLQTKGLQALKNSFVVWANPLVTKIEEAISELISEKTLMKFFKGGLPKQEENVDADSMD
jgi:hypothetical protein